MFKLRCYFRVYCISSLFVVSSLFFTSTEFVLAADEPEWIMRLQQIKQSETSAEFIQVVNLLREVIVAARSQLEEDFLRTFDDAVVFKINSIRTTSEQYLTDEYKNAFIASRLVGLCDNILKLPYRQQRDGTDNREAYTTQLSELIVMYRTPRKACDPKVWEVSFDLSISELQKARDSIFTPGWGVP